MHHHSLFEGFIFIDVAFHCILNKNIYKTIEDGNRIDLLLKCSKNSILIKIDSYVYLNSQIICEIVPILII
jgi:hypothetical protein